MSDFRSKAERGEPEFFVQSVIGRASSGEWGSDQIMEIAHKF
jgi:hypothetical protein